jgi:uncharacterized radical SAM superfamily protein
MQNEDKAVKLARLTEELNRLKEKLAEKMKNFKGVKHESALSELRYSEVMVLRSMIASLEKEITGLI